MAEVERQRFLPCVCGQRVRREVMHLVAAISACARRARCQAHAKWFQPEPQAVNLRAGFFLLRWLIGDLFPGRNQKLFAFGANLQISSASRQFRFHNLSQQF